VKIRLRIVSNGFIDPAGKKVVAELDAIERELRARAAREVLRDAGDDRCPR
jgi:hypothetical protein